MKDIVDIKSYKETNINLHADEISNEVKNGDKDPIKTIVQAKAVIKIMERVVKSISDDAIDKVGDYAKGENTYNGATFSLGSTGIKLNYDQDEIVKDLNNQLKARKKVLKQAYDLFQKDGSFVIDSDGEVTPVVGIKTEASTTISVTFKEK